jgi:putative transposase
VHLIRAAMRHVPNGDRKKVAAALRPIYTAPSADAVESELLAFADSERGNRYRASVAVFENAWERLTPFLGVPRTRPRDHLHDEHDRVAELPTPQDHQESGHFPNDDAVIKLLWLAIRDIEDARARAKEKGVPAGQCKAPGRLVEGATIQGWKAALGALALAYPERLHGKID